MKTTSEIRQMFLDFMKSNHHTEVANASLVPVNDPTVLFTTAGMHPLVPYLLGQPHASGSRITNVQRCVRTNDIEEVGDTTHLTFFEMLGYWSLGDYFKKEALRISFEFFTSEKYINLDPNRIYVTVFEGNENIGMDEVSINTWKEIFDNVGIKAEVWNRQDFTQHNLRIFPLNKKENWWGPAGETGPCGPDSEIFYWRGEGKPDFNKFVPWDDSGMFIEIGNDVFMEFNKNKTGELEPLKSKNVDFGGGLERITAIYNFRDKNGVLGMQYSVYDIDIFQKIISKIEEISEKKYSPTDEINEQTSAFRVIAEHSRSATFILADGIYPANKDQGYILRRIIRRMVRHGKKLGIVKTFTKELAQCVVETMGDYYSHLVENADFIMKQIEKEELKFMRTLDNGLRNFTKLFQKLDTTEVHKSSRIDYSSINFEFEGKSYGLGEWMFYFYETYGFPPEMFLEELDTFIYTLRKKGYSNEDYEKIFPKLDEKTKLALIEEFNQAETQHKANSKAGAEQRFKGGLADASVETTKLHTAHHLLLASMQKLINPEIKQRGSNITAERLRMDFNFDRKLTEEEVVNIENLVNEQIEKSLIVQRLEMPKSEAEKLGAQMEFGQKYPDVVSVYIIGPDLTKIETENISIPNIEIIKQAFSIEFCGGPHVSNTSELGAGGKKFKIIGQESVGAGLRRIKAALV
jgi:alanyl-tRNA synthetase